MTETFSFASENKLKISKHMQGYLLSKNLYDLFVNYIRSNRLRAPEAKQLTELIETFQDGAKRDRRALQNKFKSWSRRMDVREKDGKLIIQQTGKEILPVDKCLSLVMELHCETEEHRDIDVIVNEENSNNSYNEIVDESYNETDSLSNTSLRRKLFFHGTDRIHSNSLQKSFNTNKLESPPVTPKSCTCKDDDESHICTPNSSQFSSSPITPYDDSMMLGARITPPTISPIGKSIFKTPSTSSRSEGIEKLPSSSSTEHAKHEDKMSFTPLKSYLLSNNDMKGNDSKLEVLSSITEIPKLNTDVFECSVADMSCENSLNNNNLCLEPSIIENQIDITKTSDKEIGSNSHNLQVEPKQVDIQFDSHPSSLVHDTGYQTGSSQYVCLNSQSGLQRYLPNIAGTSDSSNISMPASLQEELCENVKGQIMLPNTHEKLIQNCSDNGNSNFSVTTFIQEQCSSTGFNSLSWKPYQCSTPSKNNICDIQIL